MNINVTRTVLATTLFVAISASSVSAFSKSFSQNWYVQGNVGMTLQTANGSNSIATDEPNQPDIYQASKLASALSVGLEGGYQGQRTAVAVSPWFSTYQIGLRYQNNQSATLKGNVTQYSSSPFDNYNYNYSITSQKLLLISRVDIYTWKKLSPFVELGVGYENHSVSSYSETAIDTVTPRLPPEFASATGGGISYLFGLGLKARITPKMWVSISDDINNTPSYKTGAGVAAGAEGVSLKNTINSQTVLLSVGYLFK
jgi:opacity protein-like surface antigen